MLSDMADVSAFRWCWIFEISSWYNRNL